MRGCFRLWPIGPLIFFFSLVFTGCGTRTLKVSAPATFQSIERLSLGPKCVECHQSLATYDGVMQVVLAGNASKSRLYQEVSSGDMPKQSVNLSDAEISAIYTWIQSGAPND